VNLVYPLFMCFDPPRISLNIYRSLLICNVILTCSLLRSGVYESRLPSVDIYFDPHGSLLISTSLF